MRKFYDLILRLSFCIFLFFQKLIVSNYWVIWLDIIFIILNSYNLWTDRSKLVKFCWYNFGVM